MANENTRKRPGGPGGPRGMFAHGKPKNTGKTILRLCGYLVRFWPLILISVICIALTTLGTVYATSLIGVAIDKYISVFDFAGLWRICLELRSGSSTTMAPRNSCLSTSITLKALVFIHPCCN